MNLKDLLIVVLFGAFVCMLIFTPPNQSPLAPYQTNAKIDSFDEPQATAEQLVILHYIKNNIGNQYNQVMHEHSDGIITEQDYKTVLERVHKQFQLDGLRKTYESQGDN